MHRPRHPALVDEGGVDDDVPVLEADLVHVLALVVVHGAVAAGSLAHPPARVLGRGGGRGRAAGVGDGALGPPGVSCPAPATPPVVTIALAIAIGWLGILAVALRRSSVVVLLLLLLLLLLILPLLLLLLLQHCLLSLTSLLLLCFVHLLLLYLLLVQLLLLLVILLLLLLLLGRVAVGRGHAAGVAAAAAAAAVAAVARAAGGGPALGLVGGAVVGGGVALAAPGARAAGGGLQLLGRLLGRLVLLLLLLLLLLLSAVLAVAHLGHLVRPPELLSLRTLHHVLASALQTPLLLLVILDALHVVVGDVADHLGVGLGRASPTVQT